MFPTDPVIAKKRELHRRAQQAEREVARLRKKIIGMGNAAAYWRKMYDDEAAEKRRYRRQYGRLWHELYRAFGRRAYNNDVVLLQQLIADNTSLWQKVRSWFSQ